MRSPVGMASGIVFIKPRRPFALGRAKPARIPITTNRIEIRQERETPIANARRCHRLFVELDEKVALLDADVFNAISEGLPKAVLGPKFADQVDIFQTAEPGIR